MKKLLLASAIALASAASQAEYAAEIGYATLSEGNLDLDAIYLVGAYEFESNTDYTSSVELMYGTGVGDDNGLELDSIYSIAYRGTFDFSNGAYVFFTPSYAKAETNFGNTDWEFGIGGGVGYEFADGISGELQYEDIDDADFISAGIRFNF